MNGVQSVMSSYPRLAHDLCWSFLYTICTRCWQVVEIWNSGDDGWATTWRASLPIWFNSWRNAITCCCSVSGTVTSSQPFCRLHRPKEASLNDFFLKEITRKPMEICFFRLRRRFLARRWRVRRCDAMQQAHGPPLLSIREVDESRHGCWWVGWSDRWRTRSAQVDVGHEPGPSGRRFTRDPPVQCWFGLLSS